jgi:hypothetical protein
MNTRPKGQPLDISTLEICSDPLPSHRASPGRKYDALFDTLKPGDCIKTPEGMADKVGQALRTYIVRKKKVASVKIMSDYGDGKGRVWLLPKP